MNAVAETKEQQLSVTDYGGGLLEVISRAARDPSVDIDKMERLIAMQERVQARDAELAFNQAMNAAQAAMRPIAANASNPQTKSRYATFDKLDRALRPIYTENGFSLSFDEGDAPREDYVRVLCYVAHTGGHTRTYHRDMPADGKGAKGGDVMTKTHAAGAAGSYGARYLLKGIWNVAVGEEDEDGNHAGMKPRADAIDDATLTKIIDFCEAIGGNQSKLIMDAYKVKSLPDLTQTQGEAVLKRLKEKASEKDHA